MFVDVVSFFYRQFVKVLSELFRPITYDSVRVISGGRQKLMSQKIQSRFETQMIDVE